MFVEMPKRRNLDYLMCMLCLLKCQKEVTWILAFAGSTKIGKVVLVLAARSNLKPVTLELGGKSPFIVFDDADIDEAVEQAHFSLFLNQGHCFCAGLRMFVHERVYDEFLENAKACASRRAVAVLSVLCVLESNDIMDCPFPPLLQN